MQTATQLHFALVACRAGRAFHVYTYVEVSLALRVIKSEVGI